MKKDKKKVSVFDGLVDDDVWYYREQNRNKEGDVSSMKVSERKLAEGEYFTADLVLRIIELLESIDKRLEEIDKNTYACVENTA